MITAIVQFKLPQAISREKYGAEPTVAYFDSPVVVDNVAGSITSS